MGRNDFTNPAVFKAETELRAALIAYEVEANTYRKYAALYTFTLPNVTVDTEDLFNARTKALEKSYNTLQERKDEYNIKLTAYKSLIGF